MSNIIYTGDNLHFLFRMNSQSVDLIYLDPPFNSKRTYSAPIGSKAAGASFKDMWTWQDIDGELLENLYRDYPFLMKFIESIKGLHGKAMMSYCLYMTQRLIEMHRVLKDSGTLYLHCDPTASHYLKLILDRIFGHNNFRNEIIWAYTGPGSPKMRQFNRKHDVILWYSKSDKWTFNGDAVRIPHKALNTNLTGAAIEEPLTPELKAEYLKKGKIPETWWPDFSPVGRLKNERTGYPTQKPLALMRRIILAASNEGDLVFDPFCGCATTCVAAQQLGRRWIGIDIEEQAVNVLIDRLSDDAGIFSDFIHTRELPERTDIEIVKPNPDMKAQMHEGQGGKCNGCGNEFELRNLEIDHIIPLSKGGSDTRGNYQLLCGYCNRTKGNRPMEYLRSRLKQMNEKLAQEITFGT